MSLANQIAKWLSDHAPLVISVLALGFTLFSFYWMNLRRGTLRIGHPRAYEAGIRRTKEEGWPAVTIQRVEKVELASFVTQSLSHLS